MRIPPVLAGVAAGAALAVGGAAAIDLVTAGAEAQSGDPVTQADLRATDKRSQAAINGYKNLNNRLGKHVNDPGQLIGARSGPIRQDRGVGGGLPTDLVADGAITSAKLAPGLLTQASTASASGPTGPAGGALNGTFPDPGIASGAVGADQLAPVLAARLASGTNAVPGNNVAATLRWTESNSPLFYDPFNLHDPAQPQRLTAPRDGLYYVSANVSFDDAPLGNRVLFLAHTDLAGTQRLTSAQHVQPTLGATSTALSGGQLFPMRTGEFVTAIARQSSGGVLLVTPLSFSIVYLGPLA